MNENIKFIVGNSLDILKSMEDNSVQMCVTSPPYYGLRDYGTARWEGGNPDCDHKGKPMATHAGFNERYFGKPSVVDKQGECLEFYKDICGKCGAKRIDEQIGLEETPEEYVGKLVEIFREVRRVLKDNGTLWLNLGDSYAGNMSRASNGGRAGFGTPREGIFNRSGNGIKDKDLIGIPWMVAFALRQPYIVPSCIKNDIDKSWMASMFDGEGCIGIRKFASYRKEKRQIYQDGFVVYTVVTNNDIPILEHCVEITGYGKITLKSAADTTDKRGIVSRKDSYGWRLEGNKAVDVISSIYPYLIAKRKQACLAFTLDNLNKNGHGSRSVSPEIQEKKVYLKELINKCNQREFVDLPSWILEPKEKVEPGWYLRSDIIWAKPNPMPESVKDRPTKSHEYIFLLSKSKKYFYDYEAVLEPATGYDGRKDTKFKGSIKNYDGVMPNGQPQSFAQNGHERWQYKNLQEDGQKPNTMHENRLKGKEYMSPVRNRRDVWFVSTKPYREAHFATFPEDLIKPCILAGSKVGDVVLDPFNGAGTSAVVSAKNNRKYVGIDINPMYIELSNKRIEKLT